MASSFAKDDEMMIEEQLRERLRKVEALYLGAATAGERDAAEAAAARLKAKLEEACRIDKPEEMKFSFPDLWSVRLFIALCRRYGLRPYRYPRQRNTTVMVKAPRRFFDAVVWRQFNEVSVALFRRDDGALNSGDDFRRQRRRRDGQGAHWLGMT